MSQLLVHVEPLEGEAWEDYVVRWWDANREIVLPEE